MGNINVSDVNTLIEGETLGNCYDIYRIMELDGNEYFKVDDLSDFDIKKAVEPVLVRSEMAKRLFKMIIKMNHPNIIRCEYFVDDGIFYVVREYNDDYYAFAYRLQIQRHLQTKRNHIDIEEEQVLYWLKQLLMAVECLHRHNVMHRFITPECISFKKDILKLFIPAGSVILSHPDNTVYEQNVWYRSPEHEAYGKIGLKYDIWCVGWTLFAICNLEDCRFILDRVDDFNEWEVPSIRRFYTREVDRIFKRMVAFNPNYRPTARDLLFDEIFENVPTPGVDMVEMTETVESCPSKAKCC